MASTKLILALFFALFYFFPYLITAQQQPFTALLVPLQNQTSNGSAMEVSPIAAALLSLQKSEVSSNRWLYFCFGIVLGISFVVVVGAILYFIFARKKFIGPTIPSHFCFEAPDQKAAFGNLQIPESMFKKASLKVHGFEDFQTGTEKINGDNHVEAVKKI